MRLCEKREIIEGFFQGIRASFVATKKRSKHRRVFEHAVQVDAQYVRLALDDPLDAVGIHPRHRSCTDLVSRQFPSGKILPEPLQDRRINRGLSHDLPLSVQGGKRKESDSLPAPLAS